MNEMELIEALGDKLWGTSRSSTGKWICLPVMKGHEVKQTLVEALQQLYDSVM